jgi:cysteine desulfurase
MSEKKQVYLDNAATTPLRKEVADAMCDILYAHYGNPSSTHAIGRDAKGILEGHRKKIADLLNAKASEIIFTSGGTEADNMAIRCSVRDLGIKHIISSNIEHKAVLDTVRELDQQGLVQCHMVSIDEAGRPDLEDLERLCKEHPGALVSLMHANNEIGTMINLKDVAEIAHRYDCLFHSDTVQSMGHLPLSSNSGPDFLTCSAHKINGPKGVGFLYQSSKIKLKAMITGGGQEKSLRAGTENTAGIAGLSKAFQMAYDHMAEDREHIEGLKKYAIKRLNSAIPGICYNGDLTEEGSLYTILNISLPPGDVNDLLLFKLDLEGICASGGSACNSGAQSGSHVLRALNHPENRAGLRLSFGIFNTKEDIDYAVDKIAEQYQLATA